MAYAAAFALYLAAGWPGVLPVPPEAKWPPPPGFTGDGGAWPSPQQCGTWAAQFPAHSVALRLPENVIALDVDHYDDKTGASQLASLEQKLGPLPATWNSTARGDPDGPGLSRQLFYLVSPGRYASSAAADIDILQRHHRYAVVWPSAHVKVSSTYQWYRPDGMHAAPGEIPGPGQLPWLPPPWVSYLRANAAAQAHAAGDPGAAALLLGQLLDEGSEQFCAPMAITLDRAAGELAGTRPGSRHDTTAQHVYHLVQLAVEGHSGLTRCKAALDQRWNAIVADAARDGEYESLWLTAARKALNNPEKNPDYGGVGALVPGGDPCLRSPGAQAGTPAVTAEQAGTGIYPEPVKLPAQTPFSFRGCIGTAAFDPQGLSDDALARAALFRVQPAVRYVSDAGAWLVRESRDTWAVSAEDMARTALSELTELMPPGDSDADKATIAGEQLIMQAARKKKLASSSGAGGIARKMRDIATVPGGTYGIKMEHLDDSPRVLWAGGIPWDLEASAERPVPAGIDAGTPHLMSAAYYPVPGRTEKWDAYCEAVWPDKEVREWALNVLAVAFTGYTDKTLPILSGRKNRGKTEVLNLLMNILGSYAHAADSRLLSGAEKAHASIVIALKGRRLSFIDEAPRTGHLAQERLKALTGNADLTGNRMGENPVSFKPTHTLILTANPDSDPALSDEAVKERVRLIPCEGDENAVRAARKAIGGLDSTQWQAEAPAVLAAMMARAGQWMADTEVTRNENAPWRVTEVVTVMAAEQDPVGQWLASETEYYEPGSPARPLYEAFVAYLSRGGERYTGTSETKWGRRLNELGYPAKDLAKGRVRPLRLRPPTLADFMGGSGGGFSATQSNPPQPSRPSAQPSSPAGNPSAGFDSEVEGRGGFETALSKPSIPASTLGFSSSSGGLEGCSLSQEEEEVVSKERVKKGGREKTTPSNRVEPSDPPLADGPGQSATPHGSWSANPVVPDKTLPPETGENGKTAEKSDSPPKPKIPRTRLTDEERAERLEARKAKLAQARVEARAAKVAELGGPLVQLPAIVLRDDPRILPCDPATAARFLEPALSEISVDVEHTGFPRTHKHYRLRLVQVGTEHFSAVFDPSDPAQAQVIRDVLRDAKILHAHSALADLIPLEAAGLCDASVWDKMADTVIAAKLSDPHLCDSGEVGLKSLAKALLGPDYALSWKLDERRREIFAAGGWISDCEVTTPVERSGWANIPVCESFVRYAASDVMDCAAVWRVLSERNT